MSLQGKVALVTGGARGIGAASAKILAERGAKIVINYLGNAAAAEQVVASIKEAGGEAIAVQADVRVAEQVDRMVEEALSTFGGRIDILVSNANMRFVTKPFLDMAWEEFSQKLNDELQSAFNVTKAVVPHMIRQKYGRLVYISSGLGKNPGPNMIAHGTSKGGLNTFVKYIAQEMAPHNIIANTIAPGLVETDATAHMPEQVKQGAAAATPLKRIAVPEDIAKAVAFFSSDEASFVTGSYTPVNGGSAME